MESQSPLTGNTYPIPSQADDDLQALEAFVAQHADKQIVVVQGLGFVGAVMSLVVANSAGNDYAVIGVDLPTPLSYWKIREINDGHFPVVSSDPKVASFYQHSRERENFIATCNPQAYRFADVIVVDINLDVQKQSSVNKELLDFDVDMTPFRKACTSFAQHCKQDVMVLVESTVPPGTCLHIVKPIMDEVFQQRGLPLAYRLAHSYERVMPGPNYIDSIQNFYRVYSGIDVDSEQAVESFLRGIIKTDEYPLTKLGSTTATEMAKVLENSYRAMNIAFMEEWGQFAQEANVNLFEIVDAIRMRPTHRNIMLPGLGVGGYCLTKDPLMASWAKQNIFNSEQPLKQSIQAVRINDQMPQHSIEMVKASLGGDVAGKKILLLGVSYLNDVGDTRYTPIELMYDGLLADGATVALHDSLVAFWEERELPVETDLSVVLAGEYDAIVVTTMHSEYKQSELLPAYFNAHPDTVLVDTWGVLDLNNYDVANSNIHVIGRGDL